MDILYFGNVCSEEFEKEILNKISVPFIVAQNNIERALLNGFICNGIKNISCNCLPSLNYQVLGNKFFFKRTIDRINEDINTRSYLVIKIPIIKYIIYFFSTIYRVIKWNNRIKEKRKIIFISVNFIPVTLSISIISKLLKIDTVSMLCDLSNDIYSDDNIRKMPFIKRSIMPIYKKIIKSVESGFDYYIFISEAMNKVNIKNRPFVVIEGIYNDNIHHEIIYSNSFCKRKIILYSGTLLEIYGVDKIIEVFKTLDQSEYELHIYGDGEYRKNVIKAQNDNSNIFYHGFISRDELFIKLQEATLLINLRNPHLNYTKYSFPSKLLEYMVSGTPILTTKLQGIPEEYYNYLYTVDNFDMETIKNKIINICSQNHEIINEFGINAKNFILSEKTAKNQVSKIIKLLSK